MKIVVVGAGLMGLTSALALARRGHEVTVFDEQKGPGLGASYANGAMLTPSMSNPWNSPGSWRMLVQSLGRSDAAMQLRWAQLPRLISWGSRFLWNSRRASYAANTRHNLVLARYSLNELERWRPQLSEYGHLASGSLRVFRDSQALDRATSTAAAIVDGVPFERLGIDQLLLLEPGLTPIASELAGAILYPEDAVGDAQRFCEVVWREAVRLGVSFRFEASVDRLIEVDGRLPHITVGEEQIEGDVFVIAAGSYSPRLLPRGQRLPVQPAKGYSVTFTLPRGAVGLRRPVVDDSMHSVVTPIGDSLRVAGTAEFAGFDHSVPAARTRNLIDLMRAILPAVDLDVAAARSWSGLRPMSADGVPVIGRMRTQNLYVSSGHGHLGWTMAVGSAELLTQIILGETTDVDPSPYAPTRFNANNFRGFQP